jgi:hypothetical protein
MKIQGRHARLCALVIAPLAVLAAACAPGPGGGPSCNDTVTSVLVGDPLGAPAPGWWSSDTRANGTVAVNTDLGAPAGFGCTSAKLTTGANGPSPSPDKAQLVNYDKYGTPLSSINQVSYWAKKSSASTGGPAVDLSLNVAIIKPDLTGFATLVYEPYVQSGGQGAIQLDMWQNWNATASTPGDGVWWSSKIAAGPGSQGQPVPWAQIQALYPTHNVLTYGFNLGSNNPNTVVAGDGLTFGTTTTNF